MKPEKTIAIIGLGYVGLPLAVEFGKIRPVIGFDINIKRVEELQSGQDHTLECNPEELTNAERLRKLVEATGSINPSTDVDQLVLAITFLHTYSETSLLINLE